MILDFSWGDYEEAYKSYADFYTSYASYHVSKHPLFDYVAFNIHCFFIIDFSWWEETKKSSTMDVKVDIENQMGFTKRLSLSLFMML